MRSAFDFAPFRRSSVGFDRLFDMLENSSNGEASDNYPPFDLIKSGDNQYCIQLAVAGFRPMEMFSTGPILYVDDLVTAAAHRGKKYGSALLAFLNEHAKKLGCKYLELDSGTQRLDAHRFYRREGLEEVALHFSKPTGAGPRWTAG